MAKEKKRLPQTTAGLINYFDEVEEGLNLKPEIVLGIGFGICVLVIVLRFVL
ncbi:MAG: preprotein translocase subunit Sec61beta [Candidatus Aenigmatarchaeota archaeon]|nr:MAG: preprotein translocase subunit Sec61beta [Candidatus Aenigmarchaeota archaeon]